MSWGLDEQGLELVAKAEEIASKRIAPIAAEIDRSKEFPIENIKELGRAGLMGLVIPKEYGGAGVSYRTYAAVIEAIARVDGSHGIILASHISLCSNHIRIAGSEEQRQRWLPKLTTAEHLGAWGLTEPGSGSDAGAARTTATREGDFWVINGEKRFITQGRYGDIAVVLAVTDKTRGSRGLTAFVAERGDKGFSAGRTEDKLGLRASDTSEMIFEDCALPLDRQLGDLNAGFIDTMKVLDGGRISIGALGLGLGQGAMDAAVEYLRANPRVEPDDPFPDQSRRFLLADIAADLHAARMLIRHAADVKDSGRPVTFEGACAKLYASEAGMRACTKAFQVIGLEATRVGHPVERAFRDVKLCEIGEGTSEVQRLVISREVLKGNVSF